jgi:HEAT repeat protein
MAAVVLLSAGLAVGDESEDARRIVEAAKAKAVSIPEQARALTRLAWPDGPITQHAVSNQARDQIVGFGDHGLEALRERFKAVDGVFQADIASAIIETRLIVTSGLPAQYLPAIYDSIWFGSMDAKRLGMFEFARYRFPMATLPIIDSAYEYPRLRHSAIRALELQGDDRARHFLGEILMEGDPEYLHEAAQALAVIGGRSIDTLRDATLSPDPTLRGAAIDALVPVSGVDDLTILYEYVALYPEDPPARMDLVLQRAAQLEAMLEARQDIDAASQYDEP